MLLAEGEVWLGLIFAHSFFTQNTNHSLMKAKATPHTTAKVKQKTGPRPTPAPAGRPHLSAEWAHLRAFWTMHGRMYNITQLAEIIGENEPESKDSLRLNKSILSKLLREGGRGAATADRLDAIVKVLTVHYVPLIQK
jgi:hypothetical protein